MGSAWAMERGIAYGGWCPKGRKAEDGPIDERYMLKETPRADYLQRTEWNLRDSDGTVIFTIAEVLSGGSKATADFAAKHGKPWLHLHPTAKESAAERLRTFMRENQVKILNVAGTRGSKEPTIAAIVRKALDQAFAESK